MSVVQLCVFILFPYRFDGISSTKVATVQSTYNFTHAWPTRRDHFFPCEGITFAMHGHVGNAVPHGHTW